MSSAYSYQLLICDHLFHSDFFVSGYWNNVTSSVTIGVEIQLRRTSVHRLPLQITPVCPLTPMATNLAATNLLVLAYTKMPLYRFRLRAVFGTDGITCDQGFFFSFGVFFSERKSGKRKRAPDCRLLMEGSARFVITRLRAAKTFLGDFPRACALVPRSSRFAARSLAIANRAPPSTIRKRNNNCSEFTTDYD